MRSCSVDLCRKKLVQLNYVSSGNYKASHATCVSSVDLPTEAYISINIRTDYRKNNTTHKPMALRAIHNHQLDFGKRSSLMTQCEVLDWMLVSITCVV